MSRVEGVALAKPTEFMNDEKLLEPQGIPLTSQDSNVGLGSSISSI